MMAVNGVELVAGQTWRTRGGLLVTVTNRGREEGSPSYPFVIQGPDSRTGEPASQSITRQGRVYDNLQTHDWDLVELVAPLKFPDLQTDPPPMPACAPAKPDVTEPARLPIKGLQLWVTAGCEVAKVIAQTLSGWEVRNVANGRTWCVDSWGQPTVNTGRDRLVVQVDVTPEGLPDWGSKATETEITMTEPHPYTKLRDVLNRAYEQAANGKGKERHAGEGVAFEDQPMATINKEQGSIDGYLYQARKKSLEAKRLPAGRDVAEILGAINYLAGAVIALESWAAK